MIDHPLFKLCEKIATEEPEGPQKEINKATADLMIMGSCVVKISLDTGGVSIKHLPLKDFYVE